MGFKYGIIEATHTHTHTQSLSLSPGIFNTNCFFTATVVTRTRRNIKLHVHCPSCPNSFRRPEWNRSNAG